MASLQPSSNTYPKLWFLANALGFQLVWWLSVLGQGQWTLIVLAILGFHLLLVFDQAREAKVLLSVTALGVVTDSTLTLIGLFEFNEGTESIIPVWLIFLWLGFAASLNHSLSMFHRNPWLAALAGGVFGSLSYLAAMRLGAVSFPLGVMVTGLVLLVVWAVLFPVSLWLARWVSSDEDSTLINTPATSRRH